MADIFLDNSFMKENIGILVQISIKFVHIYGSIWL